MKMNLNDTVKVKLTDEGIKILKERYQYFNRMLAKQSIPIEPFELKLDAEGYYHAQLWHLLEDFGDKVFLGCEVPFENNVIEVDE